MLSYNLFSDRIEGPAHKLGSVFYKRYVGSPKMANYSSRIMFAIYVNDALNVGTARTSAEYLSVTITMYRSPQHIMRVKGYHTFLAGRDVRQLIDDAISKELTDIAI